MAFRRIVITADNKQIVEDDLNRLFNLDKFKIDFPGVKVEFKNSIKPEIIIVDLNGEGADAVSRKVKDIANKHKAGIKIKNEKPMTGLKEGDNQLNKILISFRKAIDKSSQDKHDIPYSHQQVIKKYCNAFPQYSEKIKDEFNKISDETKKEIFKNNPMNENKKTKLNLRRMIIEAVEKVKKEKSEIETGAETDPKPKEGKKLEKDELGKFYIVTRPSKANEEIVHETNILDLASKIKGGIIDPSRILGAFKKRGGAKALAKIHLKQIQEELDELKKNMAMFRDQKKTITDIKEKARQTILKYKPTTPEQIN